MRKKFPLFSSLACSMILSSLTLSSASFLSEEFELNTPEETSDFITYDWLITCAKATGYTDHIPHFRRLFNTMKVRGLLECGCGFSTKYFMDHCNEVISVEFMAPGSSYIWFQECLKLYRDCTNWTSIAYNNDWSKQSFNKACHYQCSTHKDYALIDPLYLDELDQFFKKQIEIAHREENDIDVAFVDAGVYIRGDFVKVLLANKIPVVVAHDTASDVDSDTDEGLYGWFKVKTPPDYIKIHIPWCNGTTFWISTALPNVIESMQTYLNRLPDCKSYDHLKENADQFY